MSLLPMSVVGRHFFRGEKKRNKHLNFELEMLLFQMGNYGPGTHPADSEMIEIFSILVSLGNPLIYLPCPFMFCVHNEEAISFISWA